MSRKHLPRVPRVLGIVLALLFVLPPTAPAQSPPPSTVGVGFLLDGPSRENEPWLDLFQRELTQLLSADCEVAFPADGIVVAAETRDSVRAGLDRLLADPAVDLVVTLGMVGSMEACRYGELPKPTIAPLAIDRRVQELPLRDGASGVHNLSYLAVPNTFRRDMDAFAEVVSFEHLAIVAPPRLFEAFPEVDPLHASGMDDRGLRADLIHAGRTAEATLAAIPASADAVYLLPMTHPEPTEFAAFVEGLLARGLPSFAVRGEAEVKAGILMGLTPDSYLQRVARRVALNAQKILAGREAGTLEVSFARDERLYLNMATARRLGVHPAFDVLTEAIRLDETRTEISRRLDLASAVHEAMAANRDLMAAERRLAAARENVGQSRARLLPQLDLSATGVLIDEDRAAASGGSAAERTLSGELELSQLLWSEEAWADYSIQRRLLEAEEASYEQARLDVALQAANAYLNLLRAKSFEQIQKDNLRLTRSNLERAEIRAEIGSGGTAEVYRWQSQMATDRRAVIEANASRNLAEMELNRILHRPLEEPFLTAEVGLENVAMGIVQGPILPYIDNPWGLRVFRAFMAERGLARSPEILQLEASIAAQERWQRSTRNQFFSPTLGLVGRATRTFSRDGAGSGIDLPYDDDDWSVGLSLSLPLFEGGGRYAERRQATAELRRLQTQREATAQRIEQRVRAAIHSAGASLAGLDLSRQAAEAARRNLDLVADSYGRGAVAILDLLDAQNSTLLAEQNAATAIHDFILDLMEVERAAGAFSFFSDPQEMEAFLRDLETFFQNARENEHAWY